MSRQIEEGIEILKSSAGIIMNAKGEWNGSKLPRLLVERGDKVEEDDDDPSSRMWQEDDRNCWQIKESSKRKASNCENSESKKELEIEEEDICPVHGRIPKNANLDSQSIKTLGDEGNKLADKSASDSRLPCRGFSFLCEHGEGCDETADCCLEKRQSNSNVNGMKKAELSTQILLKSREQQLGYFSFTFLSVMELATLWRTIIQSYGGCRPCFRRQTGQMHNFSLP